MPNLTSVVENHNENNKSYYFTLTTLAKLEKKKGFSLWLDLIYSYHYDRTVNKCIILNRKMLFHNIL